jgi:hypothetical protein
MSSFRMKYSYDDAPSVRYYVSAYKRISLKGGGGGDRPVTKHGSLDWNVYIRIITQVKVDNEIRRAHNGR